MLRTLLLQCLFLLAFASLSSQVTDNFSDGDFTNNPTWIGDVGEWEVIGGELHLNRMPNAADTSYLSTPSTVMNNGTWEFNVRVNNRPSTTNYVEFFLASDNADLETSLNGYSVRVGYTTREISLYRVTGTSKVEIIDGLDSTMYFPPYRARVRVTRDAAGLWTLSSDTTGTGNNYVVEGSVVDLNHQASSHIGAFTKYTSTRSQWCYLDSINVFSSIAPDTTSPFYISARAIAPDTAVLDFSEVLDPATALDPLNFRLNGSANPTNVQFFGTDSSQLRLAFVPPFAECVLNDLEVRLVEDTAGNVIVDSTQNFTFATATTASYRDVIINEFFPRESPSTGLPTEEYVELYNRGTVTVNLQNWTYSDPSATNVITSDSFLLCPGEYLILCDDTTDWAGYPGKRLAPNGGLPTLNIGGDDIVIHDNNGLLIDSLTYPGSWIPGTAISLELINPNDTCAALDSNWALSTTSVGGTPGMENSVFDTVITDVTGPQLLSVTVVGGNSLQLCFDEALDPGVAGLVGNYVVDNGVGSPTSASLVPSNSSCVELVYPGGSFSPGLLYTVTASGMSDCYGNSTASQSGQFLITGPSNLKDVIVNEIFADPDVSNPYFPDDYIELYNRGSQYIDLAGWVFRDSSTSQVLSSFLLAPGEYVILCDDSDSIAYDSLGPVLVTSSFPSMNQGGDKIGLRDAFGNLIDTVYYTTAMYQDPIKDNGGWSLELINPNDICSQTGNWIASNDLTYQGTPGRQNSVYDTTAGIDPTALLGVNVVSGNSIELCFNETMDAGLLSDPSNYSLDNGFGNPVTAVSSGTGGNCVVLTFGAGFASGTLYTVTASSLSDCNGNPAAAMNGEFLIPGPSAFRDVIFNEVFSQQDLVLSPLLTGDYVELYNRSNSLVSLGGWKFRDRSTSRTLDNYILNPGDYVILCDTSDTAAYAGFGDYLAVGGFPGLNNDDEDIWIEDAFGNVIDSLYFDDSFFQDEDKEDGGWSLELINPGDTCSLLGNWVASVDPDGGTPGAVNSVFNSSGGVNPTLISGISIVSSNIIEVCFNETMDAGLLSVPGNYSIDNGLSVSLAGPGGASGNCVSLVVNPAIVTGTVYTLTMNGLSDCNGNPTGPLTGTFVQGGPAVPFQIVINEIMADPDESTNMPEGVEFIELYNNGPSVVDLSKWTLVEGNGSDDTLPDYSILPSEYVIVCDDDDVAVMSQFGASVLAVGSFPSLTNSGERIQIFDQNSVLIDEVTYDDDWYNDEVKDDGGWTLERVDPTYSCVNSGNWRASNDPDGGTPGRANSILGTFSEDVPPELLRAEVVGSNLVRAYFNEPMLLDSLFNADGYFITEGIGQPLAVFQVGDQNDRVDLLISGVFDTNTVYCLQVNGLRDCPGNPIVITQEVCFGIPDEVAVGDLLINEVLFNPYTGGSDFVELYNKSDKILDLSAVLIGEFEEVSSIIDDAEVISTAQRLLLPGEYVAVTENKAFLDSVYQPIDSDAIYETADMVAFPNTGGNVIVFSNTGITLDTLKFLDDWHFPNLDDDDGVSLERHNFNRPTQDEDNWHSAASTVRYATPGYENSQILVAGAAEDEVWLDPVTFSPDQQAPDDVLGINYDFKTGMNFRITIFDNKGRLVRLLKQNTLSGVEAGSFTWDGTNDDGHKVDVGIYIVLVEATNPNTGKVSNFKLGCVVAAVLGN